MEKMDGTLIDARDDPDKSFDTPFLYTHDGFATEELSWIQVEGQMWRRLKVVFQDCSCNGRIDKRTGP